MSTLSIKSTELQNHVWIFASPATKTAGGENAQKDNDVQGNGIMQVKFSHMAKISKIIITGRNEVNVNLQIEAETYMPANDTYTQIFKSKPHLKMLTQSTLSLGLTLMKEPVIFPLTLCNTFHSHY